MADKLPPKKGIVQKAKHTAPVSDKQLHTYARGLERGRMRTRPSAKHKRYTRIGNKQAFDDNYDLAFGRRDPSHYQERAGSTIQVFKDSEFKKP